MTKPKPTFAHSCCGVDFARAVRTVQEVENELLATRSTVFNAATRTLEPVFSRRVFVSKHVSGPTLVWGPPNHTELLLQLSKRLDCRLTHLSLIEASAHRKFFEFDRGEMTFEVLDPEPQMRSNVWNGEDFAGRGPRRFRSGQEFLDLVADRYVPLDTLWLFARWCNTEWRSELMASPETTVRWAVEIRSGTNEVEWVGEAPPDVRSLL